MSALPVLGEPPSCACAHLLRPAAGPALPAVADGFRGGGTDLSVLGDAWVGDVWGNRSASVAGGRQQGTAPAPLSQQRRKIGTAYGLLLLLPQKCCQQQGGRSCCLRCLPSCLGRRRWRFSRGGAAALPAAAGGWPGKPPAEAEPQQQRRRQRRS